MGGTFENYSFAVGAASVNTSAQPGDRQGSAPSVGEIHVGGTAAQESIPISNLSGAAGEEPGSSGSGDNDKDDH
jgi:hypothetical protein